jgi:hypothetical protein
VRPVIAQAGVAAAGSAGAVLLPGLSCASGGAAAAGVSQLALAFIEAEGNAIESGATTETGANAPERNAEQPLDDDDEELAEQLAQIDDEEAAEIIREELGEPQLMVRFRNAAPEPPRMPSWLPAVALVGMACLPLILQRIAG